MRERVLAVEHTWDGQAIGPDEIAVVRITRGDAGDLTLHIRAPFHDDPAPAGHPGPTDRLWEHEVVEVFVAGAGSPVPYTEIEVGPHGHHLGLLLRGVRVLERSLLPLEVTSARQGDGWEATIALPAALLPPPPWRALVCAVHGPPDARRYLCSPPLPGPKPDFHQPNRWAPLEL